jgi:hypothetical protein
MKTIRPGKLLVAALLCGLVVAAHADDTKADAKKDAKKEEKQNEIRKMAQTTLASLYKVDPKAQSAVEKASGWSLATWA